MCRAQVCRCDRHPLDSQASLSAHLLLLPLLCPLRTRSSFVWNYGIGAQLARYVRLSDKLQSTSPASFVGGFVLSSTVMWQSVDALM